MDNDDFAKAIGNFKNLVDSGQIPDNLKDMLNNFKSQSSTQNSNESSNSEEQPEKHKSVPSFDVSDFDINTLLKMRKIISSMNSKNDPRSNLLYSLKPYLRESRQSKVDQYINLLNMTKVADLLKNEKPENKNNA